MKLTYNYAYDLVMENMKDGITSGRDLMNMIDRLWFSDKVKGIYDNSYIPVLQRKDSIILNTSSLKSEDVGHWCVLYRNKKGIYMFYDPFGLSYNSYFNYPIKSKLINSDSKPEQNITTSICGQLCIVALFMLYIYDEMAFDII